MAGQAGAEMHMPALNARIDALFRSELRRKVGTRLDPSAADDACYRERWAHLREQERKAHPELAGPALHDAVDRRWWRELNATIDRTLDAANPEDACYRRRWMEIRARLILNEADLSLTPAIGQAGRQAAALARTVTGEPSRADASDGEMRADVDLIVSLLQKVWIRSGDEARMVGLVRKWRQADALHGAQGGEGTPLLDRFLTRLKTRTYSRRSLRSMGIEEHYTAYDGLWHHLGDDHLREFKGLASQSKWGSKGPEIERLESACSFIGKQEAVGVMGMLKGLGTTFTGAYDLTTAITWKATNAAYQFFGGKHELAKPIEITAYVARHFDESTKIVSDAMGVKPGEGAKLLGLDSYQIGEIGGKVVGTLTMLGAQSGLAGSSKVFSVLSKGVAVAGAAQEVNASVEKIGDRVIQIYERKPHAGWRDFVEDDVIVPEVLNIIASAATMGSEGMAMGGSSHAKLLTDGLKGVAKVAGLGKSADTSYKHIANRVLELREKNSQATFTDFLTDPEIIGESAILIGATAEAYAAGRGITAAGAKAKLLNAPLGERKALRTAAAEQLKTISTINAVAAGAKTLGTGVQFAHTAVEVDEELTKALGTPGDIRAADLLKNEKLMKGASKLGGRALKFAGSGGELGDTVTEIRRKPHESAEDDGDSIGDLLLGQLKYQEQAADLQQKGQDFYKGEQEAGGTEDDYGDGWAAWLKPKAISFGQHFLAAYRQQSTPETGPIAQSRADAGEALKATVLPLGGLRPQAAGDALGLGLGTWASARYGGALSHAAPAAPGGAGFAAGGLLGRAASLGMGRAVQMLLPFASSLAGGPAGFGMMPSFGSPGKAFAGVPAAGFGAAPAAWSLGKMFGRFLTEPTLFAPPRSQAAVQRSGAGGIDDVDPILLRQQLLQREPAGSPLNTSQRGRLEGMLNVDLSGVRLHTGPDAAAAARGLQAQAFTIGQDVFFGHGHYDPSSTKGHALLAHEMTHVLQQSTETGLARAATRQGGDALESDAQQVQQMVLATGRRDGLFVERYIRNYEVDDGDGLDAADVHRLNRIADQALKLAQEMHARDGLVTTGPIEALNVAIELDLQAMTDEAAARAWAEAIYEALRAQASAGASAGGRTRMQRATDYNIPPYNPAAEQRPLVVGKVQPKHLTEGEITQTLDEITKINAYKWVALWDEWELARHWRSFGPSLGAVMKAHPEAMGLFTDSVKYGMTIDAVPEAEKIRKDFRNTVVGVAYRYMLDNLSELLKEQVKLDIPLRNEDIPEWAKAHISLPDLVGPENMQSSPERNTEVEAYHRQLQYLAAQIADVQTFQRRLRTIPVGKKYYRPDPSMLSEGDAFAAAFTPPMKHTFFPGDPPDFVPDDEKEKYASYDSLMHIWEETERRIAGIADRNPSIYVLLKDDKENLTNNIARMAMASPTEARKLMSDSYREMYQRFNTAYDKVTTDEDFYLELLPIHEQLFQKVFVPAGGDDWGDPLHQAVGKASRIRFETVKFWESLGWTTASAALFLVAPFAGSGLLAAAAILGGLAIDAKQLVGSIQDYNAKQNIAQTSTSSRREIMRQNEIDSAQMDIFMNSLGTIMDLAGPLKSVGKAAMTMKMTHRAAMGASKELLDGLMKLGTMSGDTLTSTLKSPAGRELIESGAKAFGGVNGVIERSGLTGEQLAEAVGRDTDLGQRFLRAERLANEGLLASLKNQFTLSRKLSAVGVGKIASKTEIEAILKVAFDDLGPVATLRKVGGWKNLAKAVGDESPAGLLFKEWRDKNFSLLEQYLGKENIVRTGTQTLTSNDLDISTKCLRPHEAAERGRKILARLTGMSEGEVEELLLGHVFSDPRIKHMSARLGMFFSNTMAEKIATRIDRKLGAFEIELIQARVIESAPAALKDKLIAQAKALKIEWTRFSGFSDGSMTVLKKDVDDLTVRLRALEAEMTKGGKAVSKSLAEEQEKLIEELATKQAMIDAVEKEGFTGGGTALAQVSGEVGDLGKGGQPLVTAQKKAVNAFEQYARFIELEGEFAELIGKGAAATPGEAFDLMKKYAKIGERATSGITASTRQYSAHLQQLADRCKGLLAEKKSATLYPRLEQAAKADISTVLEELRQAQEAVRGIREAGDFMFKRILKEAGLLGKAGHSTEIIKATQTNILFRRVADDIEEELPSLMFNAYGIGKQVVAPYLPPDAPSNPHGPPVSGPSTAQDQQAARQWEQITNQYSGDQEEE